MKSLIEEDDVEVSRFRRNAFSAVALSTSCILAIVILTPIAYQAIQRIHSNLLNDAHFCQVCGFSVIFCLIFELRKKAKRNLASLGIEPEKPPKTAHLKFTYNVFQARNRDLWTETMEMARSRGRDEELVARTKREVKGTWLFGQYIPDRSSRNRRQQYAEAGPAGGGAPPNAECRRGPPGPPGDSELL